MKSLKNKTSSGHDGISIRLLKYLSPALLKPLTLIINQSLITGLFPEKLKIAKVQPLFKKGDEEQIENYRPISLLTSISKVFEKVVFLQLTNIFKTMAYSITANMAFGKTTLLKWRQWNY